MFKGLGLVSRNVVVEITLKRHFSDIKFFKEKNGMNVLFYA